MRAIAQALIKNIIVLEKIFACRSVIPSTLSFLRKLPLVILRRMKILGNMILHSLTSLQTFFFAGHSNDPRNLG